MELRKPEETQSRKIGGLGLPLQLGAAAALTAAALGVELAPSLFAFFETPRGIVVASVLPTRPPLRLGATADPSTLELVKPLEDGGKDLSLDAFLRAADRETPVSVKSKFAREFMADPKLRETFERFQNEEGGSAPASELMRRLGGLDEFRQLVSRFQGEPGFKGAYLSLTKDRRVDDTMRALASSLEAARRTAPAGRGASKAAVRGDGAAAVSSSGRASRSSAFQAEGSGAKLTGAWPGGRSGGAAGAGAAAAGAVAAPPGGDSSETQVRLPGAKDVGSSREIRPEDPSVLSLLSQSTRDKLDRVCAEKGICEDFARQCFIAGVYPECEAACRSTSKCSGMPPASSFDPVQLAEGDDGRKFVVVAPDAATPNPSAPIGPNTLTVAEPAAPQIAEVPKAIWSTIGTVAGAGAILLKALLFGGAIATPIGLAMAIGGAIGALLDVTGLGNKLLPAVVKGVEFAVKAVKKVVKTVKKAVKKVKKFVEDVGDAIGDAFDSIF